MPSPAPVSKEISTPPLHTFVHLKPFASNLFPKRASTIPRTWAWAWACRQLCPSVHPSSLSFHTTSEAMVGWGTQAPLGAEAPQSPAPAEVDQHQASGPRTHCLLTPSLGNSCHPSPTSQGGVGVGVNPVRNGQKDSVLKVLVSQFSLVPSFATKVLAPK